MFNIAFQRTFQIQEALTKCWKNFVGLPSALSFRQFSPDSSDQISQNTACLNELKEQLDKMSCLFPEGELKNRYFQPSSSSSPIRTLQWTESRLCLIEVVQQLLQQGAKPGELLLSLSHTTEAALVIGTVRGPQISGIGVDLENSKRKVSPRAAQSFQFPEESQWFSVLTPLHFWIIKEACFKANPSNPQTVIADYRITSFKASQHLGGARNQKNPNPVYRFQILENDGFTLAFAMTTVQ